jgi:hypothetical protein
MATILDTYKGRVTELGLDKIVPNASSKGTPYTTDDLKKADEQVLTAAKFKTGRGGEVSGIKYSDSKPK